MQSMRRVSSTTSKETLVGYTCVALPTSPAHFGTSRALQILDASDVGSSASALSQGATTTTTHSVGIVVVPLGIISSRFDRWRIRDRRKEQSYEVEDSGKEIRDFSTNRFLLLATHGAIASDVRHVGWLVGSVIDW